MSKKLKVGIIGSGEIAVQHAEGIARADNTELTITMDTNEALARDLADKYGARSTTNMDEVLESDVDIVYIATPHYLHADMAVKAARAGKHIMLEKPISTNMKDAERMIKACEDSNVKLSICYVMRYSANIRKAKELIAKGAVGTINNILFFALGDKADTYWTGGYTSRAKTDWRTLKEKSGGGILMMNISHNVDCIRYITGLEIIKAEGFYDTLSTPVEVEDVVSANLLFNNRAIGSIAACSCFRGGPKTGEDDVAGGFDRINGSDGQIVLTNPLRVYTSKNIEGLEVKKWNIVDAKLELSGRGLYVQEFADAVINNRSVPISGEDGIKCLKVITDIYKSKRNAV